MTELAVARSHAALARGSKSFAVAAKLLPADVRDDAAVLYAWCRRADDAIDESPPAEALGQLAALRLELDCVYSTVALSDPLLAALRDVVRRRAIPRAYPEELLHGLEMDVVGTRYDDLEMLLAYAYRVAGVVGLMMCHVLGVRDPAALRNAAHLGIAMQLTNVARDVVEDWNRGRFYVPASFLGEKPATASVAPWTGGVGAKARVAGAVKRLLVEAERYYRSGDRGLPSLSFRSALAVRVARKVYAAIGRRLEARGCDPTRGRVIVPFWEKLLHVASALASSFVELPTRLARRFCRAPLDRALTWPNDVLPL